MKRVGNKSLRKSSLKNKKQVKEERNKKNKQHMVGIGNQKNKEVEIVRNVTRTQEDEIRNGNNNRINIELIKN